MIVMITSMTGYGEATSQHNGWIVSVKIKTLNHKYLDLQVQGLTDYEILELRALEQLKQSFHRGRVEVSIQLQHKGEGALAFDVATARQCYLALKHLARELHLEDRVSLDHLIQVGGALKPIPPDPEGLWPAIAQALEEASSAAQRMRRREGEALAAELAQHIRLTQETLSAVEARAPELKRRYKERLQQRIRELEPDLTLHPERLEQEVALWAERSDITEEIARLKIHLQAAGAAVQSKDPAGRTLDFLAQEMYREVNTMAAKARDGEISQYLIEIKSSIDCLREQVRNIE